MTIPVDKYCFIKYDGYAYVITISEDGIPVRFQYNGVACYQFQKCVNLITSWLTKSKYLKPYIWYDATNWSNDKEKIYFLRENDQLMEKALCAESDEEYDNIYAEATELATPKTDIWNEIKAELEENGFSNPELMKLQEAYTIFLCDGKEYILTWQNCD